MMDTLFRLINLTCSAIMLILTIMTVLTYRKERSFPSFVLVFSILLSMLMMVGFIVVAGTQLNLIIGVVLFVFGAVLGVLRGLTVRLYCQGNQVMGKYSLLTLLAWGGTYVLAILLQSFDSIVVAALGLAPLVFATGVQVFLNLMILIRRFTLRLTAT